MRAGRVGWDVKVPGWVGLPRFWVRFFSGLPGFFSGPDFSEIVRVLGGFGFGFGRVMDGSGIAWAGFISSFFRKTRAQPFVGRSLS
jgi:hypothetical protein